MRNLVNTNKTALNLYAIVYLTESQFFNNQVFKL